MFSPIIYAEVDDTFQITKMASMIFFNGEWVYHGEVYDIDYHNNEIQYGYFILGDNKIYNKIVLNKGLKGQPITLMMPSLDDRESYFKSHDKIGR